jgi:hypothetical protein
MDLDVAVKFTDPDAVRLEIGFLVMVPKVAAPMERPRNEMMEIEIVSRRAAKLTCQGLILGGILHP